MGSSSVGITVKEAQTNNQNNNEQNESDDKKSNDNVKEAEYEEK